MKVTDLKENECIHCETEEQANAICKLMHEAGLEWKGGESYLSKNNYGNYESGTCYFPIDGQYDELSYAKEEKYKIYKAEQFINQNKEIMQTKITLSNQSQELNIIPLEGFEIDLENSDLKNGKVLFKEVEKKYPSEFNYDKQDSRFYLSDKYGEKLSVLDALLCLRDEYNRIDGFEEGFRFGVNNNWCITNINNTLDVDYWGINNKIMHFEKQETAKLFLNNFEEQLEQIKEFL